MLYLGAALGYWRGDIKGLVDDIGESLQLLLVHLQVPCFKRKRQKITAIDNTLG